MKILLVLPASGKWKGIARHSAFNGKVFRFSMLSLLTLASLTPDEDEITLVDEQIDDIPFEGSFDLVGITVMTAAAPRSYEIAAEFREKGVPVILGGFHPTLNPEEALMHADSIVSGCAYDAWEKLLTDVKRNSLEKIYYGNPLAHIPSALPRHIVQKGKYVTVNATFATLGCRNTCQFCSVNKFYKQKRYQRNIQEIIDELKTFKERFFIFVDDNLTQDREYALDLLRQLVSL
ncbi:MAG: cobalamin-dependent protein, partial [Candidatus Aureabacteria bacterium]|nr:cobalamin-dependent protein [Candidatus Auribacterota bacterium]